MAHYAHIRLLYHDPAQRAVPGKEQGPQRPHASVLPRACPAQHGVRDPWSGSACVSAQEPCQRGPWQGGPGPCGV